MAATHRTELRILALLAALVGFIAARPGEASATPSPDAPLYSGFLSKPTDQIAVPGILAGGEITPEGDLYTGWAEYALRFGRHLKAWDQPSRSLADPSVPLLTSVLSDGAVSYQQSFFAVAIGDVPVAYETVTITNHSTRSQAADLAMLISYTRGKSIRGARAGATTAFRYERPAASSSVGLYAQPGEAFSRRFQWQVHGRNLDRSGLLLARGPARDSFALSTTDLATPTAQHDGRLFRLMLRPQGRVKLTWQIPLSAIRDGPSANRVLDELPGPNALARLSALWRREEAGLMQIVVPEARVSSAYRAAIVEMLESRYDTPVGWVQASNKLQYEALWLRDAAIETNALDLAGLHKQAAENLEFLDTMQLPNGLFIGRAGQYDGLGQTLWALAAHAALTEDSQFASEQIGRISAAIGWLVTTTTCDASGLLPPSNPGDDEQAYGEITGDDLWAAIGLRSAVIDAQIAGRPSLVAAWSRDEHVFDEALQTAVQAAVTREGHIPPLLDSPAGQDWGNYFAAYPLETFSARSPDVTATLEWAYAHMQQGLPTYDDGRSLHDYLGFSLFQTELEAGVPMAALSGLYAELAHTTSTDNGWEWNIPPDGTRASNANLAPHGTFSAGYVALLRNLLVSESVDGVLNLLPGASPAWLAPGDQITLSDAPTTHGELSFVETSTREGATLRWSGGLSSGTRLRWDLPPWARRVRVDGQSRGRIIELSGRAGAVSVQYRGRRPRQSYANTVKALDHLYEARGQAAPLVPLR